MCSSEEGASRRSKIWRTSSFAPPIPYLWKVKYSSSFYSCMLLWSGMLMELSASAFRRALDLPIPFKLWPATGVDVMFLDYLENVILSVYFPLILTALPLPRGTPFVPNLIYETNKSRSISLLKRSAAGPCFIALIFFLGNSEDCLTISFAFLAPTIGGKSELTSCFWFIACVVTSRIKERK